MQESAIDSTRQRRGRGREREGRAVSCCDVAYQTVLMLKQDSDDRPETLHLSQHCRSDDNICASTRRSYSPLDGSHSELHQQK